MRKSYKILSGEKDTYIVLVVNGCSIVVDIDVVYLLLVKETVIVVKIVEFLIELSRYSKISYTSVII